MKKKLLALLLATVCFASVFAGCGADEAENGGEEETNQQETEDGGQENTGTEEPTKLTIWVPENLRVLDWETNLQTLMLEEMGNFELEFEVIPSADYSTKVSMSLTVGDIEDLPDVILGSVSTSNLWEYAQAGTILPLTEYYNDPELAVNIMEAYERTGVKYTDQLISPDGNIYAIATFNQSYGNEYPHKMWIYKPWLDALEEETPTTTEEFYELLKKVSQTDLNGNGKADEIGLVGDTAGYAGYFNYLMNAFVYSGDSQYKVVEDGVVSAAFNTEAWKEGLQYIRRLFEEGLILSESLTMDEEQLKTLLNGEEPTVFSFCYLDPAHVAESRMGDYICIDTLTGPEGVNYSTYWPTSATPSFMITANCKNPEAAFRLGDLLSSEHISICTRWGEEGVNWDYIENVEDASGYVPNVDGFELFLVVYDDGAFWGGSEAQNACWMQRGPYVRQYAIANGSAKKPEDITAYRKNANAAMALYQTSGHNPAETAMVLTYTSEESDTISSVETSLLNYVNEFKANVLSGNIDVDAQWESYLNEVDRIGVETWLETVQAAYDRMYK